MCQGRNGASPLHDISYRGHTFSSWHRHSHMSISPRSCVLFYVMGLSLYSLQSSKSPLSFSLKKVFPWVGHTGLIVLNRRVSQANKNEPIKIQIGFLFLYLCHRNLPRSKRSWAITLLVWARLLIQVSTLQFPEYVITLAMCFSNRARTRIPSRHKHCSKQNNSTDK